ncbi:nucleoside deaminase [Rhizobium leguminosarum]|uniref:Cytidine deaminase n=1 Tax=Rhizobium leguminosarum TaxID=384 RepID=A0A2K9ZD22_RHILE|nr:nucleoside deaminase [Rhizobium leguminosarum]AUW46153.1 Cytidine deaminase [Rhizobium leguminosarum]
MSPDHESLLRLTFEIAHSATAHGNMPFGALLAGPGGEILLEEENGYFPDLDATAHAECLLATRASKLYREPFLAQCTLYSSAEPCAMCAGAIYWKAMTGDHPDNPTMDLPCRDVFSAGQKSIEVIGPLIETEAEAVHRDAWQPTV